MASIRTTRVPSAVARGGGPPVGERPFHGNRIYQGGLW
jgi:hypothetical protein